ncbi:oligosaccharide flippase family protein [Roseisolibacter sp. H3M3-2]|uniref:lipopolysaccharide biosynthesis protein n=1 Tax=Roseisolibacter sp. H3M3-2 TaxID=3031323 RepID=UPI0023D99298|nr:oligosaccharide flippase family protein [Roseisolibacter sp. H3M3-2]MDF1502344.1 oligosaccharide flippase family protein [Roseisolibacter sp. H3M3-2]
MRLPAGGVLRTIAGVGSAALAAQAIGFAASPLLSRLFAPDAFGRFGLLTALTNVLAVVALVGSNSAIFAAESHDEALALLRAGLTALALALLPCAAAALALIAFGWFGYGALEPWHAALVGLHVAVLGATTLLQPWLARRQRYRALARSHLTLGLLRPGGQVALGAARLGFPGLAFGEIAARAAVTASMAHAVADDLRDAWALTAAEVRAALRRRRHFVVFGTATNLANNVGTALPPVLVTMGYGVQAAGLFTLTSLVMTAPIGLVQKAVGDVFIGHFVERFAADRTAAVAFLLRVAAALFGVALLGGLVIVLAAEPLFALVFGESWRPAGALAARLVPLFVADFTVGTVSGVVGVANRPQWKLVFDALRVGGLASASLVAARLDLPLAGLVTLFAWTGVLAYLVYAVLIRRAVLAPRPPSPAP